MANTGGFVKRVADTVISSGLGAAAGAISGTSDGEVTKDDVLNRWREAAGQVVKETEKMVTLSEEEVAAAKEEGVVLTEAEDGSFEAAVNTKRMADILGVDEQLIIDDINMTPLEKEQNPYTKSDLSDVETVLTDKDGNRLDDVGSNPVDVNGCEVSCQNAVVKSGLFGMNKTDVRMVHVKSDYLGEFDYDASEFALGFKELEDGSQLPVLQYIGGKDGGGSNFGIGDVDLFAHGTDIPIPEGLKSMDYMFTNDTHLRYVPPIPSSIESMHYAFSGCTRLEFSTELTYGGDTGRFGAGFIPSLHNWTHGCSVRLPDGLKDMSGAFKGCGNLNVTFVADSSSYTDIFGYKYGGSGLPGSVVNIQNAFEGCESLENSSWMRKLCGASAFPEYGDGITPYLTSAYAKDALNKITNETAKEYADTREYIVDEEGRVDEDALKEAEESGKEIDRDAITETQIRSREKLLRSIHDGTAVSDSEVSSGGARSNNYYYNAAEDEIDDDVTGLMVSDDKPGVFSSLWQRAAIDGAAGIGLAAVTKKLTGSGLISTIVGVGGAIALDYFDVIPESLVPILNWTKDKLPEGGLKEKVADLVDTMTGSTIREQQANLTAENVAATYQNRRLQRSIWGMKGAYELADVSKSMYNNAEYCAVNLNFKATADRALVDGEETATAGAKAVVHDAVSSMEEMWNEKAASGTDMTSQKEAMQEYYVGLMEALESYNKGANHGIQQLTNSAYGKVSSQGLDMLNRAYTTEVMESLRQMDAAYGFMDEEAWSKIAGMNISGVDIRNIRNYDAAKAAELSNASLVATQTIITEAGDEYVTGSVLKPRDGKSFYNEGKFYNEDAATARYQETVDTLGDVAAETDEDTAETETEVDGVPSPA